MERESQDGSTKRRRKQPPPSQEEDSSHMTTKKKPYKGIRMRKGGKWVAEIREPKKRSRLWLGSYTTDVAAARAHDIAVFYFHGFSNRLNFPDLLNLQEEDRLAMPTALIREKAAEVGARVDAQLASGGAMSPPPSDPAAVALQNVEGGSNPDEKHDCSLNRGAAVDFSKNDKINEPEGKLQEESMRWQRKRPPREEGSSHMETTTTFMKNPYRGIRKRKCGKWVAEIRQPNKRSRLWIGSYATDVAAARAYDTAAFYFHGSSARLNFPDLLLKEEDRLVAGVDMTIALIREKAAEVGARVDALLTSAAKPPPPSSSVVLVNKPDLNQIPRSK